MPDRKKIVLSLPSKGSLYNPTLDFFKRAGLGVKRQNERTYIGSLPLLPEVGVLFQNAKEIPASILDGSADIGVTGRDIIGEHYSDAELLQLPSGLGYGGANLVLAVPESWVDVRTLGDFADLARIWAEKKRSMRVATKFSYLTRTFLRDKGCENVNLVDSLGATELAPATGMADAISDLTSSGATLRQNDLKILDGGVIYRSESCLVISPRVFDNGEREDLTAIICTAIEALAEARPAIEIEFRLNTKKLDAISKELGALQAAINDFGSGLYQVYFGAKQLPKVLAVLKNADADILRSIREEGYPEQWQWERLRPGA